MIAKRMAEKVPRLVQGVDVRKFKLDPMDGFLMTRIDGKLGPKDLARETGLPDFSVARALEKLEKLGIIEHIDPSAPPPPKAAPQPEKRAIAQLGVGLLAPKYDPKELEAPGELTPEQKKRVLDYFHRLDDLDHYTLLGVTAEADKKTVKRSYFELAGYFHPDRYFGKNLGTFKPKMEALFNRITEAHDTLTDAAKRLDYDAYLDEVATTRGMEAMLERAMAESAAAAAAAAEAPASGAPSGTPSNGPPSAAPVSSKPSVSGASPAELQARREALARRLTGGGPSARPGSQPNPQTPKVPSNRPDPLRYSNPNDAMDALKRRYEARIEHATQAQAQKYVAAADDALSKNDPVAAASSLSIAVKFAPEDQALAMRYQETKNRADRILCESYEKQAVYEERAQHWPEAARNWQKVAKIKQDDAKAHERAAHAMVRCDDPDLHQAAEHAKQAIALAPNDISGHVALLEAYTKGREARREEPEAPRAGQKNRQELMASRGSREAVARQYVAPSAPFL
jgi:curved DNA-binding protein CbpA